MWEIPVAISIVAPLAAVVYFIIRDGKERRELRLAQRKAQEKAKALIIGEIYSLLDGPNKMEVKLDSVYPDLEWVKGTIIVSLPQGSMIKVVRPGDHGWGQFTVIFERDGKWFGPSWNLHDRTRPMKLDDFWEIEATEVDVRVAS